MAVMGYKHSVQHVQRALDGILRKCEFAMEFVNDITIFSRTLEEYLVHLDKVLNKPDSVSLSITPTKTFLACSLA